MTQSAALFSVTLNMVLPGTVGKGNVVCKFKQICAWADKRDVIACNIMAFKETLKAFENEDREKD